MFGNLISSKFDLRSDEKAVSIWVKPNMSFYINHAVVTNSVGQDRDPRSIRNNPIRKNKNGTVIHDP